MDNRDFESRIKQSDVENEFVMVNKNANPDQIRKSHIIRQMEEAQLGVVSEDYDQNGELNLEKFEKRKSVGVL